jgi:hypothetical protein
MTRSVDWPQQLAAFVESRRSTPFAWGTHDCCRFAAGAVEAMTGVDRMHAFTYETEAEARELITQAGGLDVLVTRELGAPLESVAFAGRGDVVLAELDNGPTLGVVLGVQSAFAAEGGVLLLPTRMGCMAWRIG